MRHRLANLVDPLLPAIADGEDRRRARVLVSGSFALSMMALMVFINTALTPTSRWVNYVGVGGLTLVFGAVPLVLRLSRKVNVAGIWAVGWATLLLAGLISSGGLSAPALIWIVFMPVIGQFFVSRRFAMFIALAAVITVTVAYGLELSGHHFQISYQGDHLAHLRWLSAVIFAIAATTIAAIYDDARHRALQLQQEINDRLRETNDNLARARDEAEAASRSKSRFLATVSHELRTPLHGILAMTSALQQQELPATTVEQIGITDRAARSLSALVEDLLRLSEIEAGALQLRPGPWCVRQGVADLERAFRATALRKDLQLTITVADNVPGTIEMDALRVSQVIGNLLGNAVKFTETGSVELTITWHSRLKPRILGRFAGFSAFDQLTNPTPELIITVTDTGPGMTPKLQQTIFEPFVRGDDSPTQSHGGTGLGLAISRRLVTHMAGRLTVKSALGVGSTFVVTLPCTEPDTDTAMTTTTTNEMKTARSTHQSTPEAPTIAPKRILVADDNLICQQVLRQLLQPLGYAVDVVSDGQEALDALDQGTFDLVLMDCEMPTLDGISAVRALREREPAGVHLTVIAVTAHSLAELRTTCTEAGMDDVLTKPFRLADLRAMLDRWLAGPQI